MRVVLRRMVLCAVVTLAYSCSTQERLVWEEDFNQQELDQTTWNFELGDGCPNLCGWGNKEVQVYTKDNHELKDGLLHIRIQKEDSVYTSTRITTEKKFEFQYGRIEMRAKLPKAKGLWFAFWMLGSNHREVGWPLCGEIDLLEYVGQDPGVIFNALHTADSHGDTVNTKKTFIEGIEDGFHVFEADWTSERITFFVDGTEVYQFAPNKRTEAVWPFDQPFYFVLNCAVGGNLGGAEIDDAALPDEFVVDYIRVFSK